MRELYSKLTLLLLDTVAIFISIVMGYYIRLLVDSFFSQPFNHDLKVYLNFWMLYAFPLGMMAYEGVYTRRYDFWHESRQVFKSLAISFILIMAILALTRSSEDYSRTTLLIIFFLMAFWIPLFKNIGKKLLFHWGLWRREVKIYSHDPFLSEEIKQNHYLGYFESGQQEPQTVFINSREMGLEKTKQIINEEIKKRHEVIFIPLIDEYNLTHSHIYELSNTRTNLIVFQNRLKSRYRLWGKQFSDMMLSITIFPLIFPVMLFIAWKIKREEPGKPILFYQKRLGKNGIPFICYKFRTMYVNSEPILRQYLSEHPEEIEYYKQYHKYRNDPRVTPIGSFLRRSSLDELPQIFNVFKGEMSFIGPRPYMLEEKKFLGDAASSILSVKPGITGLWQVSGRSDVDFKSRINMDLWYIRNWNLWMDFVILIKTIRSVIKRDGAI